MDVGLLLAGNDSRKDSIVWKRASSHILRRRAFVLDMTEQLE